MSEFWRYSKEPENKREFTEGFDRSYTRFARPYDLAVRCLPVWKTWLRQVLPHIQGPRVLEVSFGTGYLLARYAARFETHGVDFNGAMVRTARRNLTKCGSHARLVQADVAALPYADRAFDTLVNTMAFSGYPDAKAALSEMRRVLRPGGRLLLLDVNYPRSGSWLGTQLTGFWRRSGDLIRDLDALLEQFDFGFEVREVGGFGSVQLYVATRR